MTIRSLVHSGRSWRAGMPRRLLLAVLTPLVLIAVVVGWAGPAGESSLPAPAPAVGLHAPSVPEPGATAAPHSPVLPRSAPTRLFIPSIGVDAPFTDLAIGSSGRLNAPPADDTNLVGWFADGPSPGERGTAIVAGHLDTKTAPAVFAGLSTLTPGQEIRIDRADGRTVTFVVYAAENFPQDDFPDDLVYADTPDAQLRLITCGGSYDRSRQRYMENTVVFARLKSSATDG
ncbi:class F sortase [Streptomyces sp. NPDC058335]|uniref:class F sortase n=1 Tax=Streptomyces sp. NPDC058335 TaxID=3346451 RepID=UPI00364FF134